MSTFLSISNQPIRFSSLSFSHTTNRTLNFDIINLLITVYGVQKLSPVSSKWNTAAAAAAATVVAATTISVNDDDGGFFTMLSLLHAATATTPVNDDDAPRWISYNAIVTAVAPASIATRC